MSGVSRMNRCNAINKLTVKATPFFSGRMTQQGLFDDSAMAAISATKKE
jgi:hypothetical protein